MLEKLLAWTSRYIPYPRDEQKEGIEYWRSRILYLLILSMLGLGSIAYIPSVYLSIKSGIWSIAVVDTVSLVMVFFLAFSKRLNTRTKSYLILVTLYILGVMLLIFLGPVGAGFIWLFLFPVLAAILLNFRAVVRCTLLLVVTFSLMAIPVVLEVPGNFHLMKYSSMTWLVNVANFLVVNFVISSTVSILLSRLSDSFLNERKISALLKEEQKMLIQAKKKAEEADILKSIFLANMSHEIRTPMNGIIGFMELLKNEEIEDKTRDRYLDIIHKSGTRMLGILNDLINISKIEADQMEICLEEFDLEELVQDTLILFEPEAKKKNLKIEVCSDVPEFDPRIVSDKNKIAQILTNLIQNSIKFTDKGSIQVSYRITPSEYGFSVSDTGMGIEPAIRDKIFERFHHTVSEADRVHNGAGLGLAISKGFVDLLGGRIWVESELKKGSIFHFTLPVRGPVS